MKKTLLTALLLSVLATGAGAQNAAIQGRVLDGGAPAEYATVLLKLNGNTSYGMNTDEAGHFRFDSLRAGNYQLVIMLVEYQDTVDVMGIGSNETRDLGNIHLTMPGYEGSITILTNPCAPIDGSPNAEIRGLVLEDGIPAEYATVMLTENGVPINGANTDEGGRFRFIHVKPGDFSLIITYGDLQDTIPVTGLSANEIRVLGNIKLRTDLPRANNPGCGGGRPLILYGETSSGSFYNFEQIRHNPAR